jgi:hypothetical protein
MPLKFSIILNINITKYSNGMGLKTKGRLTHMLLFYKWWYFDKKKKFIPLGVRKYSNGIRSRIEWVFNF